MVVSASQSIKNKFKIYKLVKNHFGLDNKSIDLFKYRLFQEPHVAPEYAKILKEFSTPEDPLRARVEVTKNLNVLSSFDSGWTKFKSYFGDFCRSYGVSYSDFRANRITINKQQVRFLKALTSFYETKPRPRWQHQHTAECIKRHLEEIGTKKISVKNKMELVLSLNFADWFLCSTEESWGSCLNLDSDYEGTFWSGLPGLIGDKNRSMLYLTDMRTKNYQGIITDKVISRSWVLTLRPSTVHKDRKNRSNSFFAKVSEYPCKLDLGEMAREVFKIDIRNDYDDNCLSRYYIENLFHCFDNKDKTTTSYIYQDTTNNYIARKNKAKHSPGSFSYLKTGGNGVNRFDRNGKSVDEDPFYSQTVFHIL